MLEKKGVFFSFFSSFFCPPSLGVPVFLSITLESVRLSVSDLLSVFLSCWHWIDLSLTCFLSPFHADTVNWSVSDLLSVFLSCWHCELICLWLAFCLPFMLTLSVDLSLTCFLSPFHADTVSWSVSDLLFVSLSCWHCRLICLWFAFCLAFILTWPYVVDRMLKSKFSLSSFQCVT